MGHHPQGVGTGWGCLISPIPTTYCQEQRAILSPGGGGLLAAAVGQRTLGWCSLPIHGALAALRHPAPASAPVREFNMIQPDGQLDGG